MEKNRVPSRANIKRLW